MRRLLAALLCLSLPAGAWSQVVSGARSAGPQAVPPFVAQLGLQLEAVAARLETGSSGLAPSLPSVALPPALAGAAAASRTPAPQGVSAAVEYLSRAALPRVFLRPAADDPLPDSARVAAAALADPALRASAAVALRSQGPAGEAVAQRLDELGRAVEERRRERPGDFAALDRLGRDLRRGPSGDAAYAALARHFSGAALGASEVFAPGELSTPEDFAGFAARRFTAGAAADRPAAVAYPAPRSAPEGVPADSELRDRVALSPLTNPERERVVVELFRQAGASPDEIKLQDAGRGRHNIYVVKKGRTDRVVVVGGHHDKVGVGAGTIDNWTGATMVVNLYQALRGLDTEATYVFIAFAREEEGLLGSRHYVSELTAEERGRIDAMLNLDTMGVNATLSWRNKSDRVLLDLVMRLAREKGLDLQEVSFWGGDSDQTSFRRAGILGVMLFGATEDVVWDIIHSARDTIAAFSLPHYKNAYLLSLELLKALDQGPVRLGLHSWWASLRAWLRSFLPLRAPSAA